jgi:hypothetical protein
VNGADAGGVEIANNLLPVGDFRIGTVGQAFPTGASDPLAHFAGGAIGEGDGDQPVEIDGFAWPGFQFPQEPLREHEGFATAGPGGEADREVAGFNRPALLVGVLNHH